MKIYDKHFFTTYMTIFGLQILVGVFGLVRDYMNTYPYILISLGLIGIVGALYFKKYPYVEIANGEIIKQALFKNKRVKIADIKSFDKVENTLIIKSENTRIKIPRGSLDVLEISEFEEYVRGKINKE